MDRSQVVQIVDVSEGDAFDCIFKQTSAVGRLHRWRVIVAGTLSDRAFTTQSLAMLGLVEARANNGRVRETYVYAARVLGLQPEA